VPTRLFSRKPLVDATMYRPLAPHPPLPFQLVLVVRRPNAVRLPFAPSPYLYRISTEKHHDPSATILAPLSRPDATLLRRPTVPLSLDPSFVVFFSALLTSTSPHASFSPSLLGLLLCLPRLFW